MATQDAPIAYGTFSEPSCALVPGGSFLMGCSAGRDDEMPVHRVVVYAFEMAAVQVCNSDFATFMEATGHPPPPLWNGSGFNHPDQPVVAVNWVEAVQYCEWLRAMSGRQYRLPAEAEWEWAALGGREGALYPWGNEPPHSWPPYMKRWGGDVKGPLPVGEAEPNPYGLYDVSENVHEWCADWYQKNYYAASPESNPTGPKAGERRASRGGSWRHQIKVSRCAARSSIPPSFQYADYGFRVVRDPLPQNTNDSSSPGNAPVL
ncbi:MAG TPA: SUMF1/EgtB/PvdO family nonheme iron enzyme [Terriglobia bacterium]|nr:SUMF1/EgtB/PvdO family nonheme iron enzyme [Terriglobia bacterium]